RLRDRSAPSADHPGHAAGAARLSVSRASPPRGTRMAARRVEAVGDRPRGEVLQSDPIRSKAARRRAGELETPGGGHRPRAENGGLSLAANGHQLSALSLAA